MAKGDTLQFTIPGRPKPKGRPRFYRGNVFTPKDTLEYEAKIREHLPHVVEPFEGNEIYFRVDVYFRTKVHGDLDNYVKIAQDALNKVAYHDDKQIKHMEGRLHFVETDEEVRMEITVIDG